MVVMDTNGAMDVRCRKNETNREEDVVSWRQEQCRGVDVAVVVNSMSHISIPGVVKPVYI